MNALDQRRSVMTLYTEAHCPQNHCVRLVVAEKDIEVDIQVIDKKDERPAELSDINPYNEVLTFVDKDVILYDAQVIMEYLEERFPHPSLMPLDPVSRANNRMYRQRVKRELYPLVRQLEKGLNNKESNIARGKIRDTLQDIAPIFAQKTFFLSDDYSLMDCYMAPLLWRLKQFGIELDSEKCQDLQVYAQRIFSRQAFQNSLSDIERAMNI